MLTRASILDEMRRGTIEIEPFDPKLLNPNSYNVRLGDELIVYCVHRSNALTRLLSRVPLIGRFLGRFLPPNELDVLRENAYDVFRIPEDGFVLQPGTLYLGRTVERTYCSEHVPMYEGRSSTARIGLESHICGGFGDVGFNGTWTLEIRATYPTRIYAGMEIGQVGFQECVGKIIPYGSEEFRSRYQGQTDATPSRYHE